MVKLFIQALLVFLSFSRIKSSEIPSTNDNLNLIELEDSDLHILDEFIANNYSQLFSCEPSGHHTDHTSNLSFNNAFPHMSPSNITYYDKASGYIPYSNGICNNFGVFNDMSSTNICFNDMSANGTSFNGSSSNNPQANESCLDESVCSLIEGDSALHEEKQALLRDLEARCRRKNPSLVFDEFDLRDFDIGNWPDVTKHTQYWKTGSIQSVRNQIENLEFKWRERIYEIPENLEQYFGNANVIDSKAVLDFLTRRFRVETGLVDAKCVDFHYVYKDHIPEPFRNETINRYTIQRHRICGNDLIINNIHFWKYAEEDETNQGKMNQSYVNRSIISKFISKQFLNLFRKQTGSKNAETIVWKRLIKEKLPAKYRGMKFNCGSILSTGVYVNLDFINNVHFEKFTEKESHERFIKRIFQPLKAPKPEPLRLSEEEIVIEREILNKFRNQSRDHYAKEIDWGLVKQKHLPANYKYTNINQESFFGDKMYLDPALISSLRFEPYAEWALALLKRIYEFKEEQEVTHVEESADQPPLKKNKK